MVSLWGHGEKTFKRSLHVPVNVDAKMPLSFITHASIEIHACFFRYGCMNEPFTFPNFSGGYSGKYLNICFLSS
ncbi:unnamed protein product [Hermetia illucens]|uniref:Uncharacterized protein n=1 Tax=Hermetia illucens TaxID=343691 RepID=A0A7R8V505_HERIL|nr:unnamed protein product [Hermetia illucens]